MTTVIREWLDSSGRLTIGKYKGSQAEDIASDDPSYIRWIIETVEDISEDDRNVLSQYLTYAPRRRG